MRWRFYDRDNQAEAAQHAAVIGQIDAWWVEFSKQTERLGKLFQQKIKWDLPTWMEKHLQSIHPGLMWEFGPAANGDGHRLVITPEAHRELRPLTDEILARAPQIKGWEFYGWRLAEPVDMVQPTVEARAEIDITGVTVALSVGEHHRIDLTFAWDELPDDEDQALHAVFVATETLLGEEWLDRWAGSLDSVSKSDPPEPGQRFLPLNKLHERFQTVISSIQDQLRPVPYSTNVDEADDDEEWSLLKLEPEEMEDYPGRTDLLTCLTCYPDMTSATFSSAPFSSERFARNGETFCYLKIDGSDPGDMTFADREEMEIAAAKALVSRKLGGLVGGGTGLRYSYVEVALTEIDQGIAALREAMRIGKVPTRSWILFHDADLSGEWIGIYDDSPEPPWFEDEEDEEDEE